jgi:tetraacyldisaccharide 4'-kinase
MSAERAGSAGPAPWLPRWLARGASTAYEREIARRNRAYDRGEGVTTLEVPVISVGNLSVGGTGKTPLVEHVVRVLAGAGRRPCIAMRGYRSKNGVSDEAEEYREGLRDVGGGGVVVVVQPDRIAGIREAQRHEGTKAQEGRRVDCVVLDDGFQHRKIARQFDVVLVDATRPFVEDRLLPMGWLREGPASLARADAVVVTRADRVADGGKGLMDEARRWATRAADAGLIGACAFEWVGVEVTEPDGSPRREPVEWLRGQRVVSCCAIGNPRAFLGQVVEAVGDRMVGSLVLRDHDAYEELAVAKLRDMVRNSGAEAIVTTRKDWMKLRTREWACPVARPVVGVRWKEGGERIEAGALEVVGG